MLSARKPNRAPTTLTPMTIYFRTASLPELANLPPEQATARATQAQEQLGLKPSLVSAALFGGATLLGGLLGWLLHYQLIGTAIGWFIGMWLFKLVKINASRPILRGELPKKGPAKV
jgi:hypothetical protein